MKLRKVIELVLWVGFGVVVLLILYTAVVLYYTCIGN